MGRYHHPRYDRRSSSSTISSSSSSTSSLCHRLDQALHPPRWSSTSSNSIKSTSKISLRSSHHGRMRRQQRALSKYELKRAIKYGKRRELPGRRRLEYRFNGLVVIVDGYTKTEITSYKEVMDADVPFQTIYPEQRKEHDVARKLNQQEPRQCKSHSILLIDKSGSMRTPDVQGCNSRLASVFLAIAQDFIRPRIDAAGRGMQDAVSVIIMGERPFLWMNAWPTDFVTYNAFVAAFKHGHVQAEGHCCYRPSIDMAQTIFDRYDSAMCQLVLGIFTDGRPSDSSVFKTNWDQSVQSISTSVQTMAAKIGNRLQIRAIGMGSANQWQTLETMCQVARNYGCQAQVETPSMSSSSLGAVVSSIATSLTASQVDNHGASSNGINRVVRPVHREDRSRVPLLTEAVDATDFDIFMQDKVVREEHIGGDAFVQVELQHPEACGVAVRKQPFDEGSERFAYQFFEVAQDGRTVVGMPLVAKACKFVLNKDDEGGGVSLEEYTHKFVTRFCRIHTVATQIANVFNERLDKIARLDSSVPRIEFLPCSVYRLEHDDGTTSAYVVEPRLFGKFQKWNSNNGWIRERSTKPSPVKSMGISGGGLVPIKEEVDDEVLDEEPMDEEEEKKESSSMDVAMDSSSNAVIDLTTSDDDDDEGECLFVQGDDVAQAFSHFSYSLERQKLLVCDLQGVYDRQERLLRFTDPVIHYVVYKETEGVANKRGSSKYGRTDRGNKGIADFFDTHPCNCLCNIVTKGFLPVKTTNFEK